MKLKYKDEKQVFNEIEKNGVLYLEFPILAEPGVVRHGISTRLGGVSEGIYSSMNLSFTRGDSEENVRENYRRIGKALGVREENMVCSVQTHTTNIRVVTEKDRGKGVLRSRDYKDVDGMVTNIPGICLVTYYADCVPLLFTDPVKRVIGSAHSGWRGTCGKIGQLLVEKMQEEYGCRPGDIRAAVGPSICRECYEVSEDVIDKFKETFDEKYWNRLFYRKPDGKYQLDLWYANEVVLLEAGIRSENLAVTNLCTCCNPDLLFSHRASDGKRGNLAAFIALK